MGARVQVLRHGQTVPAHMRISLQAYQWDWNVRILERKELQIFFF